MSNLGAIPKAKGGARPKTKVISNGGLPNLKKEELHPNTKSNAKESANFSHYEGLSDHNYCIDKQSNYFFNDSRTNQIPTFSANSPTNNRPLEQRDVISNEEGVQIKRPALSPEWVEKRIFIHYTRPPIGNAEEELVIGASEAWIEQMEFLIDDLSWLLNLPHYRFWSQVVYDKSLQECLETYLMNGPRWYDQLSRDDNFFSVIEDIHQLIFLIYVRMATYKESKENFITPSVFGELIYENFLYDVCKMLDLCALYGTTNKPLLEKMINNIFENQPKYYEDLGQLVQSLKMVLENLQKKLGIFELLMPMLGNSEMNFSLEELRDIVQYMVDTFCSLQSFLEVFPKACETFRDKEYYMRLATFYECAIPKLTEYLLISKEEVMADEEQFLDQSLIKAVNLIRASILGIFRQILACSCLPNVDKNQGLSDETLSKDIETFTHMLTSCIEEKIFLTDYNNVYDVNKDLAYFQERGADMTTLNFMKEAVESIASEIDLPTQSKEIEAPKEQSKADDMSGMNGYYAGETSCLTAVEIDSMASSVQDLLPHLGTGFVKECLKYYNYSSEEVLNALLEQNLPPNLDCLDRSLKDSTEPPPDVSSKEPELNHHLATEPDMSDQDTRSEVLVNRQNIYDDDEFDVFSRKPVQISHAKVHKGKSKKVNYEKDPELNEKVKNIIHQYESNLGYSIYDDEEKYTSYYAGDYEDEYDDTYDDNETGDIDNFGQDKMKRERFITIRNKGALNAPTLGFDEDDEEEGSDGEAKERKGRVEEEVEKRGVGRTKGKGETEEASKKTKFKKANASNKRGNLNLEEGSSFVFTNSSRGRGGYAPSEVVDDQPENETTSESHSRSSFVPFCENPVETRRRMNRKAMNLQYRNKGYPPSSNTSYQGDNSTESDPSQSQPNYHKTSTKTNKHSGKSWRQGPQGDDDDSRRPHGGKYKEDTNHGKSQDKNFRHKMIHKNQQRRNAAQAKYRNNF